ncbi:MAG TPA: hypothetical protein VFE78_32495 [Gemmataceae bacterium]|jgi:hypothetical protein|nr:hypothetical protein [Gemmataceae bacterium]
MRTEAKWIGIGVLGALLASGFALVATFAPPGAEGVAPGPQRVAADSVIPAPGEVPASAALPVRPAAWGYGPPGASVTLGTVGLTDLFTSVFALNSDGTWVGLRNNLGGQSFICYSQAPPVSYTYGTWRYDARIPAVNFYGPDRAPLATLNGFNLSAPVTQGGAVSGWHCGPAPGWSFIPR